MSILQTSGIIYLLQSYMSNMSKRIIKAPKLYFMDTGLCAYLCKWPSSEMLKDGALYPVEIKKGIAPTKPTKNFSVLEKYKMPIKRGMVIDNTDAVRAINDNAFYFPVSLLGV